jgi:V/A-type H+-transporting ATPase subunit I
MKRLSLVVLERDGHAVMRAMGRLGAIHLVRTKAGPDTAPLDPPDHSEAIGRCDEMLARIENLRRRLGVEEEAAPAGSTEETPLDELDPALQRIEAEANDLLKKDQGLRQEHEQATSLLDQASVYRSLDIPLDRFGESPFLHFSLGTLPAGALDAVRGKVAENVVFIELPEQDDRQPVIAVATRKGRYALDTTLEEAGFQRHTFSVTGPVTASQLAEETRTKQGALAAQLQEAADALAAFTEKAVPSLVALESALVVERHVLDAEQHFPRTEATTLVTGWVAGLDVPLVRRRAEEVAHGRYVAEFADPGDVPREEIPVLLRHGWFLRPFSQLVRMYGLPGYGELEPTVFVAISYILMFGMMFGDAGHGLVVVLAGVLARLKGKTLAVRDAGTMLILLGLASVASGVLYGSYFGVVDWNGRELSVLHDPLKMNPLLFMGAGIGFGILLMSIGLLSNAVNRLRRGDIVGALMDKFGVAGAVFYWGVLAVGIRMAIGGASDFNTVLLALVIAVPLGVVFAKEPLEYFLHRRSPHGAHGNQGSLVESLILAPVEVFEAITGYLANTISFVRLAAYSMAHAAVLKAAFTMGDQAAQVPYAGVVLCVVIIVLGNVVAIGLEGIVVAVQALRLEYYEFFGKFFSGSGRAFAPFRFRTGEE